MKSFSGIPREKQKTTVVASVECFEEIPCNLCETACPEGAIDIGRVPRQGAVLNELKCTGCGVCLTACPSGTPVMIREKEEHSVSELVLPWRGRRPFKPGEFATFGV